MKIYAVIHKYIALADDPWYSFNGQETVFITADRAVAEAYVDNWNPKINCENRCDYEYEKFVVKEMDVFDNVDPGVKPSSFGIQTTAEDDDDDDDYRE